jgi:hypothetical protein
VTAVLDHPDHASPNTGDSTTSGDAPAPLAYAYMRVPCDIPDDKVQRMEHELRRHAERMGLHLAGIFSEFVCGIPLCQTGVRHRIS